MMEEGESCIPPNHEPDCQAMRINKKNNSGESRELLLKEYFLNAYLIALLKQFGAETKRRVGRKPVERVAEQN